MDIVMAAIGDNDGSREDCEQQYSGHRSASSAPKRRIKSFTCAMLEESFPVRSCFSNTSWTPTQKLFSLDSRKVLRGKI